MKHRYFQINLNKRDERTREMERKRRSFILKVALFAIIFVGLFGVMVYKTMQLDDKITERKTTLKNLTAQIDALEQETDFVAKDDLIALHELDSKRVIWSKKLSALSEITPKNVSITTIYFRKNRMQIEGLSRIVEGEKEFDRVVLFMDKLKSNSEFSKDIGSVIFEESNRVNIKNQNLLHFTIACHLKN